MPPHDLIGDNPEDAFHAATNVSLREAIKLGLKLWEHTKGGEVTFTSSTVADVEPQALELMRNAASLTVTEYRKRLHGNGRRATSPTADTPSPSDR